LKEWKTHALAQTAQAKVYQLTPRPKTKNRRMAVVRRSTQRLKRVVNR
jgi:hypothetical protein